MDVTLAVPTLKRYDLLSQLLIASAEKNTRPPDRYFIVDNGGGLDAAAYGLPSHKTTIYKPGKNLGVAASWNYIFQTVPEPVILACDDMDLWPGTVAALTMAWKSDEETDFFFPEHHAHTMFGVYLMRKRVFAKIGEFDERFYPAYFEDNDFHRRMQLAGIKEKVVAACGMNHVGSGTMKAYSDEEMHEHHRRFEDARNYYLAKWGGMPGHEAWVQPFNGK